MPSATGSAWLLLLLAALPLGCLAQQLSPLYGRGRPAGDHLDIYVSTVLDRLFDVDDSKYQFECVLYFYLDWRDPRARPAMESATLAAQDPAYNSGNGCRFPCGSMYSWQRGDPCCDDFPFLPHFEFVNARGFSQERVMRYGIRFPSEVDVASGVPADTVSWWVHVQGLFYIPLQFRAFPFDKQFLIVQVDYANRTPNTTVSIISSTTGTQLYQPLTGNDISGWEIRSVEIRNFSRAVNLTDEGASNSLAEDPWPLNPHHTSNKSTFSSYLWGSGFEVIIVVSRIATYYMLYAVLPICINVWLCMLVFAVSPKHLDTRLGIVVTLFLSLTAMQYVVNTVLPSSSEIVPTQQLVIVSYCVLGLVALMSIFTYIIATNERQLEKKRRIERAREGFRHHWKSVTQTRLAGAPSSTGSAAAGAVASGTGRLASVFKRRPAEAATASSGALPAPALPGALEEGAAAAAPASPFDQQLQQQQQRAPSHRRRRHDSAVRRSSRPEREEGQFGGIGVMAPEDDSDTAASSAADSSEEGTVDTFSSSSSRRRRGGVPHLRPAAAPPRCGRQVRWPSDIGGDVEQGGESVLPAGAVAGAAGAGSHWQHLSTKLSRKVLEGKKPSWFKLQQLKMKATLHEMNHSKEYALYLATRMDKVMFWATFLLYTLAIILIFALQANDSPELIYPR